MASKACWLTRILEQFSGQEPAILEQLDPRQRRAKPGPECFPMTGLTQRFSHPACGMAQERNGLHAGEHPAFPENERRIQVTHNGLFDLRQPASNRLLA